MTNIDDVKIVFDNYDIDVAYIEAALWFNDCEQRPLECMKNNFIGTHNILETAKNHMIGKIVFASSASLYGDSKPFPFKETNEIRDYSFYSNSKLACERLLETYYRKYGLKYAVLRYMNIYGPRQDYRRDYTGIVMKTIRNIYYGISPVIFGDGLQTLDLVYVEDIAKANVEVGFNENAIGIFNISTGIETDLNTMVNKIISLMKCNLAIQYQNSPNEIIGKRCASYEHANKIFGYKPQVMLDEGLKNAVNWYISQMNESKNT